MISSFSEAIAASGITLSSESSAALSPIFTANLTQNSYLFVPPPGDSAYFHSSEWMPPLPSITGKPFKLQAPPKGKGRRARAAILISGEMGIATNVRIGREGVTKEVKVDKTVENNLTSILEEISEGDEEEVEAVQKCTVPSTEPENNSKPEVTDIDTSAAFPTAAVAELVDTSSVEVVLTTLDPTPGPDAHPMGSYWSADSLDEPRRDFVTRMMGTFKPSKKIRSRGIVASKPLRPLSISQHRPLKKTITHLHLDTPPTLSTPSPSENAVRLSTSPSPMTPIRPRRPAPWTSEMARAGLFIKANVGNMQGATLDTSLFQTTAVPLATGMGTPVMDRASFSRYVSLMPCSNSGH